MKIAYAHFDFGQEREDYGLRLLTLILERAGLPYELIQSEEMTVARAIREIEAGHLSVAWMGSSREFSNLHIVDVPIDLGLTGYRLIMISRQTPQKFAKVRNLTELSNFTLGQGLGWQDSAILRNGGLSIKEGTFPPLLNMLKAGRIDGIPLGINEIYPIIEQFGKDDFDVDPNLLIHYPFGMYFHVNPGDKRLIDCLDKGMRELAENGKLLQFMKQQPWTQHAFSDNANSRRLQIELPNPSLPEPLADVLERYSMRFN